MNKLTLRRIAARICDTVFPRKCILCGELLDPDRGAEMCEKCLGAYSAPYAEKVRNHAAADAVRPPIPPSSRCSDFIRERTAISDVSYTDSSANTTATSVNSSRVLSPPR